MTPPLESRTISIWINRPTDEVYAFASVPENFPKWASGLAKSISKVNDDWIAETAEGPVKVQFAERNPFGVLDHYVIPSSGADVHIPMRVIANGTGSEVFFTLFRLPHMSDEQFAADTEWVKRDLRALKTLLEA
jgi:hypothetical protein